MEFEIFWHKAASWRKIKENRPHLKFNFTTRISSIYLSRAYSKAWKWHQFDFGPTFTHFYLLKNVNFKIQFVLRFVL